MGRVIQCLMYVGIKWIICFIKGGEIGLERFYVYN